ncbi:hypothetical protein RSO01_18470 [Reyranella soli]|uniref:Uncharacterized protein n=1 Tax=Reyranella soli TaxID=1230389 RepID=A0A512N7N1_9HYPH|nr:hypothetical protein RSO01_18470 [Reyranella soli]
MQYGSCGYIWVIDRAHYFCDSKSHSWPDDVPRKRPSAHSDAQFAAFVDRIKNTLHSDEGARFEEVLRKLILKDNGQGRPAGPPAMRDGRPVSPPNVPSSATMLPKPPDFAAIEKAARDTAADRQNLMTLIGQLVFSWSNNESLLIYVMMLLLRTDERSAAVVFSTLNTTRARLDLVRRLSLLHLHDPAARAEIDKTIELFNDANRIRNEFMHAMYLVNEQGQITHTQMLRFIEKKGRVSFGDRQPLDGKRMRTLVEVDDTLRQLNRQLWGLLPRLQAAMASSSPG